MGRIYRHYNARLKIEGDLEKIRKRIQDLIEWKDMLSEVWSIRLNKQLGD